MFIWSPGPKSKGEAVLTQVAPSLPVDVPSAPPGPGIWCNFEWAGLPRLSQAVSKLGEVVDEPDWVSVSGEQSRRK